MMLNCGERLDLFDRCRSDLGCRLRFRIAHRIRLRLLFRAEYDQLSSLWGGSRSVFTQIETELRRSA